LQVLFQNEHNVRSSIVNRRKRSLLLYNHLLDVEHVVENVDGWVGFCASYYSEVDDRCAEQNEEDSRNDNGLSDEEGKPTTTDGIGAYQGINNNGISGHSCNITPHQAMEKLVFIVKVLNVNTDFNGTSRSKMK
jgi:hypothetical protein